MPQKPVPSPPPEVIVADWVIQRIPRLKPIPEAELWKLVNWNDPRHREIFNEHRDAALELLSQEGYIQLQPAVGPHVRYGSILTLTIEGRRIKDAGGYLTAAEAKEIKDAFQADIALADGRKKKWDNRSKYVIFGFSALSAILTVVTLWEKCAPNKKTVEMTAQHAAAPDSPAKKTNLPLKKDPVSFSAKKNHPHTPTSNSANLSPTRTTSRLPSTSDEPQAGTATTVLQPKPSVPLRIITADNIEFKLITAEGSAAAQTIALTLLLTSSAPNGIVQSRVHSIFDPDGNEYLMKTHRFGAETFFSTITLNTGVPIKCIYTFGGVLPSTRLIKLFAFSYLRQTGETHSVELRDIPVDWN